MKKLIAKCAKKSLDFDFGADQDKKNSRFNGYIDFKKVKII